MLKELKKEDLLFDLNMTEEEARAIYTAVVDDLKYNNELLIPSFLEWLSIQAFQSKKAGATR